MKIPSVKVSVSVIANTAHFVVSIGDVYGTNPDLNNAIYAAVDRFVNAPKEDVTTTGEVIHTCGFIHGDFEPCKTIPGQVGPVMMHNRPRRFEEPDRHCVTQPNGDCVSTDPRDMHAVTQADGDPGDEHIAPWNRYNP